MMRYKTVKARLAAGVLIAVMMLAQGCGIPMKESEAQITEEPADSEIEETIVTLSGEEEPEEGTSQEAESSEESVIFDPKHAGESSEEESEEEAEEIAVITPEPIVQPEDQEITFDPSWTYGEFAKISSGTAKLYYAPVETAKGITVCINAGHGTEGGSNVKTQCHPDGTPKVTGGTTEAGALTAYAVSTGTSLADGTAERDANLKVAMLVKEKLLEEGYNVLMIRESQDVQLDNIARTLMANAYADCHIAIHYDGTESDKGAYFMSVPSNQSYREMEPVKSHWEEHNRLGNSVIQGLRDANVKVMGEGSIEMDLTQTSYSTVPSIDLEVGDKVSDRSDETLNALADGICRGLNIFFEQ